MSSWIPVGTGESGVPVSELPASAWPAALDTFSRTLRELHSLPPAECPFSHRVAEMFTRAEDVVARGAVNADFLRPEDKATPRTNCSPLPAIEAQEASPTGTPTSRSPALRSTTNGPSHHRAARGS